MNKSPCAICNKDVSKQTKKGAGITFWAIMSNGMDFEYGWVGTFTFKDRPKKDLKKDDLVCNKCLDKMPHDEMKNIICTICGKEHSTACSGYQGWGCSAFYRNGVLMAGFGSKFDCDHYKVTDSKMRRKLKHDDVVCDLCIERWEAAGFAKKVEGTGMEFIQPDKAAVEYLKSCKSFSPKTKKKIK